MALIIIPPDGQDVASNWACHARGVAGVSNAILVLDSAQRSLANQLAAAGHAVHVVQAEDRPGKKASPDRARSLREPQEADGSNGWRAAHFRLVVAALKMSLDVVLTSAYGVWKWDVSKAASLLLDDQYDMGCHVDGGDLTSSFFFTRSRPASIAAWNHLLYLWEKKNDLKVGKKWIKFCASRGLKFQELRMPQILKAGADMRASIPLIMPQSSQSKKIKLEWLKKRGFWRVNDYDFACTVASCQRY